MNPIAIPASKIRRTRPVPKGRAVDPVARAEILGLIEGVPRSREYLIENLHRIQDRFGSLSAAHLNALAEAMKLSMAEVYEVATFYHHFDVVKEGEAAPAAVTVRVCETLSCRMAGAQALLDKLPGLVGPNVRVIAAPCIGRCAEAPAVCVGQNAFGHATPEQVAGLVKRNELKPAGTTAQAYDAYVKQDGYKTWVECVGGKRDVESVIKTMEDAGLRGLGGAGFPAGRKWRIVRGEPGPRLMAVNIDEGEPGTFKDRHYLERDPHRFIEGMLIAAWAVEAETCFIYLRDEYPGIREILLAEIAALEGAGIVAKGYIDLRRGAGAYICGEESAMIESIEGKRGLPRHRPPYVAQVGIFDRPTLVHNIETLHWVARICREGPEVLNATEKNGRKGLRSYSVSGRVRVLGVYLLPAGSTIRDIIAAAGGMAEGHKFTAYQPGGPSSGLLPASIDDVPLDFDTLQPLGTFIGSAAVVVLSDQDSPRAAALNMLKFFEKESCGQCTPCRVGCEKAVKLMSEPKWDRALLEDLCQTMADASICGLGQAAPNPIRLTLQHFPDEV
jgi:formate dehydrogenase beta subunit